MGIVRALAVQRRSAEGTVGVVYGGRAAGAGAKALAEGHMARPVALGGSQLWILGPRPREEGCRERLSSLRTHGGQGRAVGRVELAPRADRQRRAPYVRGGQVFWCQLTQLGLLAQVTRPPYLLDCSWWMVWKVRLETCSTNENARAVTSTPGPMTLPLPGS